LLQVTSSPLHLTVDMKLAKIMYKRFLYWTDNLLANVNWCRPSVCHLSITLVCPTQLIEIFDDVSMPFGTLTIPWHPRKILWTGEPFRL